MSNEHDELSAEEMDSLLRELEGKASGSKKAAVSSDDDEDIEAFLRSLEEQDASSKSSSPPKKVAVADTEEDPFAAQFAELERNQPAPLEKVSEPEEKKSRAKKPKKKKKEKPPKESSSEKDGRDGGNHAEKSKKANRILKFVVVLLAILPVAILWWIVGSYLAQWVTAGWLIAMVSAIFVLGVPALVRKFVKRGGYLAWLIGASALLSIILIVPMPETAGTTLAKYSHWPVSAVGQLAGWELDNSIVRANSYVGEQLASSFSMDARQQEPLQLGTQQPLVDTTPQFDFEQIPGSLVPSLVPESDFD